MMKGAQRLSLAFVLLQLTLLFPALGIAQARGAAFLVKGALPTRGIPGFGENAFPALYGEYLLETGASGENPIFSVWISREPMVLPPGEWRLLDADAQIFEKTEDGAHYVTLMAGTEGAGNGLRRILIQIPLETQEILGNGGVNRLVRAWLARFNYFFSLIQREEDISLPATLNY